MENTVFEAFNEGRFQVPEGTVMFHEWLLECASNLQDAPESGLMDLVEKCQLLTSSVLPPQLAW